MKDSTSGADGCEVCGETDCVLLGVRRSEDPQDHQARHARHYRLGYEKASAQLALARIAQREVNGMFAEVEEKMAGAVLLAHGLRLSLRLAEQERDDAKAAAKTWTGNAVRAGQLTTAAMEMLRRIEWNGEAGFWEESGCPECRNGRHSGHAHGCELAALLLAEDAPEAPSK